MIAASVAAQSVGAISGTLSGDDGAPLAAIITISGVPPLRASGSAKSSATGGFTINSLAPGAYHACAEAGSGGYLDLPTGRRLFKPWLPPQAIAAKP
jgi:hypothetical protein